jgi:hypothetical protein
MFYLSKIVARAWILFLLVAVFFVFGSEANDCGEVLRKFFQDHKRFDVPQILAKKISKEMGIEPKIDLSKMSDKEIKRLIKAFSNFPNANFSAVAREFELARNSKNKILDVNSVLPNGAQSVTRTKPCRLFINCYNAVELFHSPLAKPDYRDSADMRYYLREYFHRLQTGVKLKPGDVIVVLEKNQHGIWIQHAAVYISNDLIWHKPGFSDLVTWKFVHIEDAFLPYFLEANKIPNEVEIRVYRAKTDSNDILRHR